MSDFDYSKENTHQEDTKNPVDKYEKDYSEDNRAETNKNIKLLNEILNVSVPKHNDNVETKKKKTQKYDNMVDLFFNLIKEPIYIILLYLLIHTKQVNNLLVRYLPEILTNPDNFIVYYGFKGLLLAVVFLLLRYKL